MNPLAIANMLKFEDPVKSLLSPSMSATQAARTLAEHHQASAAVDVLAHNMGGRKAVWWASQSCRQVADKLTPTEQAAAKAAGAWARNPTPQTLSAAAKAAADCKHQGPAGLAAKAAALHQTPVADMPADPGEPPADEQPPRSLLAADDIGQTMGDPGDSLAGKTAPALPLTPLVAAGAVKLAAALSTSPSPSSALSAAEPVAPAASDAADALAADPQAQAEKITEVYQPFLEMGHKIAAGAVPWA